MKVMKLSVLAIGPLALMSFDPRPVYAIPPVVAVPASWLAAKLADFAFGKTADYFFDSATKRLGFDKFEPILREIQTLKDQFPRFKEQIEEMSAKIHPGMTRGEFERSVLTLADQIDQLIVIIPKLHGDIIALRDEIPKLQGDIIALRGEIQGLRREIERLGRELRESSGGPRRTDPQRFPGPSTSSPSVGWIELPRQSIRPGRGSGTVYQSSRAPGLPYIEYSAVTTPTIAPAQPPRQSYATVRPVPVTAVATLPAP
jgi:hypothetical protein